MPGVTAPLTAVVEIVAGVMLVLGLGTRIAAMALSVVMRAVGVHHDGGPSAEFSASRGALGGGRWAAGRT